MPNPLQHSIPSASPELLAKAKLIKDSPFFTATFVVGANPLIEKQQVFLSLVGIKPVSYVSAAHWTGDPAKLESAADDKHELGAFLDELGLAYHFSGNESETLAVVSKDSRLVEEFVNAPDEDNRTRGRLLGYPQTAIEWAETRNWREDEADLLEANGLAGMVFFRFSRDHAGEELEVVRQWRRILETYGLA
ncbi:MAG TPA: hypothetical protein VFU43_11845 [Streptosporangiaceae bacterium]|nr:hypothetical protein [Streptosporangiaceae bacterium]